MAISTTLRTLYGFISLTMIQGDTPPVKFAVKSALPDNSLFLIDETEESCAAFSTNQGQTTPAYTQFRVGVQLDDVPAVNVTLVGTNLGCGDDLFLSPISASQMNSWTGRWSSCRMTDAVKADNKDTCIYSCNCPETCKEIQILKRPRNVQSSNWTMCEIEQKYRVSGGCEVIPRNRSGVYQVNLTPDSDIAHYADVYCDMETDGGGWTVLVRRQDGSVNFAREWDDYKNGFGSLNGEFWAGNELMHLLTTNGRTFLLRFDLEAYDGDYIYAVYENFSIGPESDNYRLRYSEYWTNSTAGDSLETHNGMMFSTMSRDNDAIDNVNCASNYNAGWWYRSCYDCGLTTLYGPYSEVPTNKGIKWSLPWGNQKFAKYATMMVRPI